MHVRSAACANFETMLDPHNQEISHNDQKILLEKLSIMTTTDVSNDIRKNAQLCLFAIRDRTYRKIKGKAKNEREFNEYISAKHKMRTKHVFGPSVNWVIDSSESNFLGFYIIKDMRFFSTLLYIL